MDESNCYSAPSNKKKNLDIWRMFQTQEKTLDIMDEKTSHKENSESDSSQSSFSQKESKK